MIDGVDVVREALRVHMHDQFQPKLFHRPVAECDHVARLPAGIDVEQRKRRLLRPERLARQVQENRRVLADRVEQHGFAELRRRLPENVNALGFKEIQMGRLRCHAKSDWFGLIPGEGPLTPALSRQARLGELATLRVKAAEPSTAGRTILGSLLPVRARSRVRQQKWQARQDKLAWMRGDFAKPSNGLRIVTRPPLGAGGRAGRIPCPNRFPTTSGRRGCPRQA